MPQDFYADEIASWFTYHAPVGDQAERYTQLRAAAKEYALLIGRLVPDGPEREWAWARLREVAMWANAGIACGEVAEDTEAP